MIEHDSYKNLIIVAQSMHHNVKDIRYQSSICSEHDFGGLITDPASLEYVNPKKAIVGVNFPYVGLDSKSVLASISLLEKSGAAKEVQSFITFLNKFDVLEKRSKSIEGFIRMLNSISERRVGVAIDPSWCNKRFLSSFFSVCYPYDKIYPVISVGASGTITKQDIVGWADISQKSAIKQVWYIGPTDGSMDFIEVLMKNGFSKVGISPEMASQIIMS